MPPFAAVTAFKYHCFCGINTDDWQLVDFMTLLHWQMCCMTTLCTRLIFSFMATLTSAAGIDVKHVTIFVFLPTGELTTMFGEWKDGVNAGGQIAKPLLCF